MGVLRGQPGIRGVGFHHRHQVPAGLAAAKRGDLTVFCVRSSDGPGGHRDDVGLSAYQWARRPDEPLDSLPEAERHAALVTSSKIWSGGSARLRHTVVQVPVVAAPVAESRATARRRPRAPDGVPERPITSRLRQETLDVLKHAILHQPQQRFGISAAARTIPRPGRPRQAVLATALAHDPVEYPPSVSRRDLLGHAGAAAQPLALQTALAKQAAAPTGWSSRFRRALPAWGAARRKSALLG